MENIKKNSYEIQAWINDTLIIGVDEAGRGCLAGPVVAAAAMIHKGKTSPLIKDSKALTPKERIRAFQWAIKNSTWGIGIVHQRLIDQKNIYQATKLAMKRAITQVLATSPIKPSCIVIDAVKLTLDNYNGPIHSFPFGESISISIAAASIIAKVTRDKLIEGLDADFPGYKLAQHKGYGTPVHRDLLKTNKASLIHRISFAGVGPADRLHNLCKSSHKKQFINHGEEVLSNQNIFNVQQGEL